MTESPAILRPCWFVGLSGHRHLANPEEVSKLLSEILSSLREEVCGDVLAGVSSIAIGADTLFARALLSLSLPWRALLPSPVSEFRGDFAEEEWKTAQELLNRAVEVDVRATPSVKNEAYLECGMDTVDQTDVLIAVWDEKPARGTGGTAEIVAYARSLKRPVIILNPEKLTVRREGFAENPFSDAEMEYLNRLPDGDEVIAVNAAAVPPVVLHFFGKVDRMAARVAPNFRRWVASSIVMNSCATVLVASTIAFALRMPLLDAVIFVMTAGAMGSVLYLKFRKIHSKWIHCRVAAEICRAAIATWELPSLVLPNLAGQGKTFLRLTESIRMLHLTSRPKVGQGLEYLRRQYVEARLDDQLRYHQSRLKRLATMRTRLIWLFWICSGLAVARAIVAGAFSINGFGPEVVHALNHFLPLVLPCVAGCALALISVFDLNRQIARSRETEAFLTSARDEASAAASVRVLQRAIQRVEQFLSREIAEWYTLSQEPRYS